MRQHIFVPVMSLDRSRGEVIDLAFTPDPTRRSRFGRDTLAGSLTRLGLRHVGRAALAAAIALDDGAAAASVDLAGRLGVGLAGNGFQFGLALGLLLCRTPWRPSATVIATGSFAVPAEDGRLAAANGEDLAARLAIVGDGLRRQAIPGPAVVFCPAGLDDGGATADALAGIIADLRQAGAEVWPVTGLAEAIDHLGQDHAAPGARTKGEEPWLMR